MTLERRSEPRSESYFTADSTFVARIAHLGNKGVESGPCYHRFQLYVSGHGKSEYKTLREARAALKQLTK
jgi:hypothetical protein